MPTAVWVRQSRFVRAVSIAVLERGTQLSGYRIDGVVAGGRMGVVYRATQLALQRTVALRVLAPQLRADESFCERFRREAMLQAALEHPHVLPVYEVGETGDTLFVATRFVGGTNLKQLVLGRALTPERSLDILAQIASALDAAHDANLIHRGVKPQNILVDESGHAYLADFGLVKDAGEYGLSEGGAHLDSLDYVSPEQIRHKPPTPRTDLYALAAVLYESLSGQVPFARETEAEMLYAHLSEPPPRLRVQRGEIPEALDEVIAKGLAKEPEARFETASELVSAARTALNGSAQTSIANRGAWPWVSLGTGRMGRLPVVALVSVLAVAVAGFIVGLGQGRTGDERASEPTLASAWTGALRFAFPSDARLLTSARERLGLDLREPIVLAWDENGQRGELWAGIAPGAEGPLMLPPAFVRQLGRTPQAERIKLGGIDALRYRALRHRLLKAPVGVYVVPTNRGAATVACLPTAALGRCETIAATLSLSGATARGLGPDARYAAGLKATLANLNRARARGRTSLAQAQTPRSQAEAARALERAFRTASLSLRGNEPTLVERPAHRMIVRALDVTAAGYRTLRLAAARDDAAAFTRATGRVQRAEGALGRALASLVDAGYDIRPRS